MEFDLRIIRALLDLSQEELARDLGITRVSISNLERGKVPITKVYKMAIGYLVEHKYCDIPPERSKLIREMLED